MVLTVARPKGSRNRVTRELRVVLDRLEREEVLQPRRWFLKLEEIALGDGPDRVQAARVLLAYRYGLPQGRLQIEHEVGESAEALLVRIARSEEHRRHLEALERRRLTSGAVTVEAWPKEPPD